MVNSVVNMEVSKGDVNRRKIINIYILHIRWSKILLTFSGTWKTKGKSASGKQLKISI